MARALVERLENHIMLPDPLYRRFLVDQRKARLRSGPLPPIGEKGLVERLLITTDSSKGFQGRTKVCEHSTILSQSGGVTHRLSYETTYTTIKR